MAWIRSGSCPPERCKGQCCTHIGMWVEPSADAEWLKARGLLVAPIGNRFLIDIPQRCQHLTAGNLCDIYGQPSRPQNCNDWPIEPANTLLDDCGYEFSWREDEVNA